MTKPIRYNRKNSGQLLIITALIITALTLSLVVSIQFTNSSRIQLRYKPVNELLLGLTSDLERSLTHALSRASQKYYLSRSIQDANVDGEGVLLTWKESVLTSYSSLGLKLSTEQEPYMFKFQWGSPEASSTVNLIYNVDVPSYEFEGWKGTARKLVFLEILLIDDASPLSTTIEFSLTHSTTTEKIVPIPNLTPENLTISSYNPGLPIEPANIELLEYLGNGRYTLTFDQTIHPSTKGLSLLVITPDDGIYVNAINYVPIYLTLGSRENNAATENLGEIGFGTEIYSSETVPAFGEEFPVYPFRYFLNYTSAEGYAFQNWEITGEGIIEDPLSYVTAVIIEGNCTITAVYYEGYEPPPPPTEATILLESRNVNSTMEHNLGSIILDSTTYENLPQNAIVMSPDTYTIFYSPLNESYTFVRWESTGDVIVNEPLWQQDNSIYVLGDGTLIAYYEFISSDEPEPPNPPPPPPPPPPEGDWSTLYLDDKRTLVPYELWSGHEGHDETHSSTGNLKQVSQHVSPPSPYNITLAEVVNITMYVTPRPWKSIKDVDFELGFTFNGEYYKIDNYTQYITNDRDIYLIHLYPQEEPYVEGYGTRVIPADSTIILTVTVTFLKDNGFLFIYHGYDFPSRIDLY